MEIEIKIDAAYGKPKVIVLTDRMTEEVNALVKRLSREPWEVLAGFQGEALKLLEQQEIIRVYASKGRVFAVSSDGEFLLRLRLYELEERLDKSCFVRISNSEIINLKRVKGFDLSFAGTICVTLTDGGVTYVSRRYVSKIKRVLGI